MDENRATYTGWAEAFTIFAKYEPDAKYEVAAEHDIVYAGRAPEAYSDADKARLEALGWDYDESLECFYKMI